MEVFFCPRLGEYIDTKNTYFKIVQSFDQFFEQGLPTTASKEERLSTRDYKVVSSHHGQDRQTQAS